MKAQAGRAESHSLREVAELIGATRAPAKDRQPLLKLATFGDQRTDKGALRHDGNLLAVSGIEGDYDAEVVTAEEGAARLRAAGLGGLIYTTASHRPEAPRWRVLCPLAAPVTPVERDELCARLNGALGGILSGESFTRSQTYYFGALNGQPDPTVMLVEGQPLDLAQGLPVIGKGDNRPQLDLAPAPAVRVTDDLADLLGLTPGRPDPLDPDPMPDDWGLTTDWPRVRSALDAIKDADDRDRWLTIGAALHHASDGNADGEGRRLWDRWSQRSAKYEEKGQRATWKSFRDARGRLVTIRTLFHIAKGCGWTGEAPAKAPVAPSRLSFLTPAECEAAPSRGYLVKGLFAPRDLACIFGAPGAGKSLLAPYLGYMVAQGAAAFGMRTKMGPVFYVAAEDPQGMRGRVRALKTAHGDAVGFRLVEGVSDLLAPDSADLSALLAAVEAQRPSLIFLDTLAMSFPGLEENSAEAMGRVVTVARSLTSIGAAVVLIHHDTKAEGSTPRGHSLFNGALDMALHVKRDESGIIRGKLTKNRNGTCDRDMAFRIATEDGGTDEDGDEIRLPRCAELPSDDMTVALVASERALIRVLSDLQHAQAAQDGVTGDAIASIIVPEASLREACCAPGVLSDAETRHSRVKAYRRALDGVAGHGVMSRFLLPDGEGDGCSLNLSSGLPNDLLKPGHAGHGRDMKTCPTGDMGGQGGTPGTHPLGVSRCPVPPTPGTEG